MGPKRLKVKHQAFPHNGSAGLKQPAHMSQKTIMGLEPRVQLDVAGKSKNFLVYIGAIYSVLTSYSRAFSSQTCNILGATGKTITKRFTQALLCCWDGQIFYQQFLVVSGRRCFKTLLRGKLTIFTSHQVKQLLNGRGHLWMTDQRILRYQVVLMENPGLTISL